MENAKVSFYVTDEKFEIPFTTVSSFTLYSSIHSSYPFGEIVLDDPEGKYLTYLGIKPGNIINIVATPIFEIDDPLVISKSKEVYVTPMRVVSLKNPDVNETDGKISSLGGKVTLNIAHPWAIFSDYSNRSFSKKCSQIIREVIQQGNNKRGFKFEALSIDDSDDTGAVVRYKLGESEAKFIHSKVLPYTTINKMPAYSFIDEIGVFHLHNFKKMYDQTPLMLLIPPIREGFGGLLTDADASKSIHQLLNGSWDIGSEFKNQFGNFKKTVYVESSSDRVTFLAQMPYYPSIPGYVLVQNSLIEDVSAASGSITSNILPFRDFEDAIRLDVNSNSIMDEFFQIKVTTTLAIDVVQVGSPIELRLMGEPYATDSKKTHWANGKWLVTRAKHFSIDGK